MSRYEAHRKRLHHLVWHLAFAEARRLKLAAVGPEVILLAILHPEAGETIAARVLCESGLDRATFERRLTRFLADDPPVNAPQLNPAAYQLVAMAEGIAAGLGAEAVTAEHVLLAAIWEPSFYMERLEPRGPSREQLYEALASHGFSLPHDELPAPNPRRFGPPMWLTADEMRAAVGELQHVLPRGASFGCNIKAGTDEAFIVVDEGLDAERYVRLALARSSARSA